MTAAQYDECMKQLNAAGAGTPAGRLYHPCYGEGDRLRLFDVWELKESFEQFGQTLGPILQQIGIDAGAGDRRSAQHRARLNRRGAELELSAGATFDDVR